MNGDRDYIQIKMQRVFSHVHQALGETDTVKTKTKQKKQTHKNTPSMYNNFIIKTECFDENV